MFCQSCSIIFPWLFSGTIIIHTLVFIGFFALHTFMPIIYGPHLLMRGWILCSQRLRVHRAWIIIKKVWKRETIILNGILFDEKEKRKIFYLLKPIFNTFEIWYALCFFINWLLLIVSYDYIYILIRISMNK